MFYIKCASTLWVGLEFLIYIFSAIFTIVVLLFKHFPFGTGATSFLCDGLYVILNLHVQMVSSTKNDGFSLSSGDFPTLGSEREHPGKNTESQGNLSF